MKVTVAILAIIVFSLVIFLPLSSNIATVAAADTDYEIQHVDHTVEVMYSGHIIINDTIEVTDQVTDGFLIGFPYKYGLHVLKCVAYDANSIFPVSLDVPLENRSGFYGAKISFPQGSTRIFTVVFILSNDLLNRSETSASADFPAYPSLAKNVTSCNVSIVLPEGSENITITKDDGAVSGYSFTKENLSAFTYAPAIAAFSVPNDKLRIIDVKELNREIEIGPVGEMKGSDSYRIVNNSTLDIGSLEIAVPQNASNFVGTDQFGRTLTVKPLNNSDKLGLVNVTFIFPLKRNESAWLTVKYSLPSVAQEQANKFSLDLSLFPPVNYYIEQASVTVVLPEGARILNPETSFGNSYSLTRDVFQQTLSINRQGVTYLDSVIASENDLQIEYEYSPLWLSFRPTLWIWALAIVGCTFVALWRRPKAPMPPRIAVPKLPVGLRPEYVKSFTSGYEEKKKVVSELKSLKVRARKGRIPRRRYKVQRKTLETRLDALARNLTELKETMRSAGGLYADLMRQLEVAETEINEVETNIKSIEARHSRGELSLGAYRKLLADYQRRRDKAETTVNGILLRLREETR